MFLLASLLIAADICCDQCFIIDLSLAESSSPSVTITIYHGSLTLASSFQLLLSKHRLLLLPTTSFDYDYSLQYLGSCTFAASASTFSYLRTSVNSVSAMRVTFLRLKYVVDCIVALIIRRRYIKNEIANNLKKISVFQSFCYTFFVKEEYRKPH